LSPIKDSNKQNNDDQQSIGNITDEPVSIIKKSKSFLMILLLPFRQEEKDYPKQRESNSGRAVIIERTSEI
jgi:hypothetical protein